MPILVSCGCGQQLRVADQNAGQRVKCPACQSILSIPGGAAAPAPSSASAGGVVQFNCSCGTLMQAKQEHAGKMVQCPRCQSKVVVPAMQPVASRPAPSKSIPPPPAPVREKVKANGDTKIPPPIPSRSTPPSRRSPPPPPPSSVQKKKGSRARPAVAFDEDGDDFDAAPVRRRAGGARSSSMMPWIIAGAVVLLLAGGGLTWWLMRGKSSDSAGAPSGPDYGQQSLAFVPGTAQGFVSVRVADLWNSPLAKKALEEAKKLNQPQLDNPAAALEQMLGLNPQEIEQVTFVGKDFQDEVLWFIIASTKPFDRAKVRAAAGWKLKEAVEKKVGDRSYFAVDRATQVGPALCFADDHILLFGPEKGIKQALEYGPGKTVKGPLDDALKVAEGKHAVVAGGVPPGDLLAAAKAQMQDPFTAGLKPALDLKSATVVIELGDALSLQLSARYPDKDLAEKAKKAVEGVVAIAKMFLPNMEGQMKMMLGPDQGTKYFNAIKKVVDDLKVDQKENDVSLEVKVPTDLLQEAISMAPQLLIPKARLGPQRGEGFGPPGRIPPPQGGFPPPGGFPQPPQPPR